MTAIKIKSIRPIGGEPLSVVALDIYKDGESRLLKLTVPIDFCSDNGIAAGSIDENTLETLSDAARLCEAVRRGEAILAFAANSRANLVSKLIRKGISAEYARRAADILCERGFINDRENAIIEAERCAKKLWGERRILQHLSEKGYRGEVLDQARASLEDIDFFSNCRLLIKKKYGGALSGDRREREKAVAALVRYGYSVSMIRAVITRMGGEEIEDCE